MKTAGSNAITDGDGRDGFLFVGNQLIVDFVNTLPVIDGQPTELLPDANSLARWLVAAGLCGPSLAGAWRGVRSKGYGKDMDALHAFREFARSEMLRLEHGLTVSAEFVASVNEHLMHHPSVSQLSMQGGGVLRESHFAPKRPRDAFGPLAADIAQLLTDRNPQRLRKCSNCALHFVDTSKKGTRRWCSMALCGNRSKVAAYARRVRN